MGVKNSNLSWVIQYTIWVFSVLFLTMYSVHILPATILVCLSLVTSQVPLIVGGVSDLCSPQSLRAVFTNLICFAARSKTKLPSTLPDFLPIWSSFTLLPFT